VQLEGIVKKISTKTGTGRKGPWILYSFALGLDNGTEQWVTFGFGKAPPFAEGDRIGIEANEDDKGYLVYVQGTGRIIPAAEVPAGNGGSVATQSTVATSAGASTNQASQQASSYDPRQAQIVHQHSQEMAIAAVGLLLAHEGLPITGAKTKAGEAKRFDEILAFVDKLTIKFQNDVITGRLNSTVADMGVVVVTAKDAIPAAEKTAEKADTSGDDY